MIASLLCQINLTTFPPGGKFMIFSYLLQVISMDFKHASSAVDVLNPALPFSARWQWSLWHLFACAWLWGSLGCYSVPTGNHSSSFNECRIKQLNGGKVYGIGQKTNKLYVYRLQNGASWQPRKDELSPSFRAAFQRLTYPKGETKRIWFH